jgi:hypothetical protein
MLVRRSVLSLILCLAVGVHIAIAAKDKPEISRKQVAAAEKIIGLSFTRAEADSMLPDLDESLASYRHLIRCLLAKHLIMNSSQWSMRR